jgi:hypothetical protein
MNFDRNIPLLALKPEPEILEPLPSAEPDAITATSSLEFLQAVYMDPALRIPTKPPM